MIGNLGPTMVKGYDSEGDSKWFDNGLPDGYTGSPPEVKEPEPTLAPQTADPVKRGPGRPPAAASNK